MHCDEVGYLILAYYSFQFHFPVFLLVLVSFEINVYQTHNTVFDHISKHLDVHQNYSIALV